MGHPPAAGRDLAEDAGFQWRYRRCLARVVPAVDELVADYASAYCMRAFQRRRAEVDDGAGTCWLVAGEPVVDLVFTGHGATRLLVHDLALVRPLRRRLRSRHVEIEYDPT